jgi:hypothetical protein
VTVVFRPGDRIELNATSGNEGRKAFVLYIQPDGDPIVRFDGFAYNSHTMASYCRLLPPEPFRPVDEDGQDLLAVVQDLLRPMGWEHSEGMMHP